MLEYTMSPVFKHKVTCCHEILNEKKGKLKFGMEKNGENKVQLDVSLMFLPHLDVLCGLLLYRPMAKGSLFIL